MIPTKTNARKSATQILFAVAFCLLSFGGLAHGSDSTSQYMVELSTRSLKVGYEFGKNDLYLSIRSTNEMLFEDYLYTRGDTVINREDDYSAAEGVITVGVGYDTYWSPSNYDIGLRTELAYSYPYSSYHSDYQSTFDIINELNFIINKRLDHFSVGAAVGPETTWRYGHWINYGNPNWRVDKKNHEIQIDLDVEVFARAYF